MDPAEREPPDERDLNPAAVPASSPVSPLRTLIVLVPLLVIVVMGANLLGLWSWPGQEEARKARLEEIDRSRTEYPPPEPAEKANPSAGAPAEEAPPDQGWRELKDLLDKFGAPSEPPAPGTAPEPLPGPATSSGLDPSKIAMLAKTALPDEGARLFKMCAACHTSGKGEPAKIGPNLWGIAGRTIASDRSYSYSEALKVKGGAWTDAELAEFLHDPRSYAPGTRMAFRGIADPARIASLIAYLHTLSDGSP